MSQIRSGITQSLNAPGLINPPPRVGGTVMAAQFLSAIGSDLAGAFREVAIGKERSRIRLDREERKNEAIYRGEAAQKIPEAFASVSEIMKADGFVPGNNAEENIAIAERLFNEQVEHLGITTDSGRDEFHRRFLAPTLNQLTVMTEKNAVKEKKALIGDAAAVATDTENPAPITMFVEFLKGPLNLPQEEIDAALFDIATNNASLGNTEAFNAVLEQMSETGRTNLSAEIERQRRVLKSTIEMKRIEIGGQRAEEQANVLDQVRNGELGREEAEKLLRVIYKDDPQSLDAALQTLNVRFNEKEGKLRAEEARQAAIVKNMAVNLIFKHVNNSDFSLARAQLESEKTLGNIDEDEAFRFSNIIDAAENEESREIRKQQIEQLNNINIESYFRQVINVGEEGRLALLVDMAVPQLGSDGNPTSVTITAKKAVDQALQAKRAALAIQFQNDPGRQFIEYTRYLANNEVVDPQIEQDLNAFSLSLGDTDLSKEKLKSGLQLYIQLQTVFSQILLNKYLTDDSRNVYQIANQLFHHGSNVFKGQESSSMVQAIAVSKNPEQFTLSAKDIKEIKRQAQDEIDVSFNPFSKGHISNRSQLEFRIAQRAEALVRSGVPSDQAIDSATKDLRASLVIVNGYAIDASQTSLPSYKIKIAIEEAVKNWVKKSVEEIGSEELRTTLLDNGLPVIGQPGDFDTFMVGTPGIGGQVVRVPIITGAEDVAAEIAAEPIANGRLWRLVNARTGQPLFARDGNFITISNVFMDQLFNDKLKRDNDKEIQIMANQEKLLSLPAIPAVPLRPQSSELQPTKRP